MERAYERGKDGSARGLHSLPMAGDIAWLHNLLDRIEAPMRMCDGLVLCLLAWIGTGVRVM